MPFEEDYHVLIHFAKQKIHSSRLRGSLVNAKDIVNDAYIKYIDSGKPYNANEIKRIITRSFWAENEYEIGFVKIDNPLNNKKEATSHVCKYCNDIKPVGLFSTRIRNNKFYVESMCKQCKADWSKRKRNKIRGKPPIIKKHKVKSKQKIKLTPEQRKQERKNSSKRFNDKKPTYHRDRKRNIAFAKKIYHREQQFELARKIIDSVRPIKEGEVETSP